MYVYMVAGYSTCTCRSYSYYPVYGFCRACQKSQGLSTANYRPLESEDLQKNTDVGCSPDPLFAGLKAKGKFGLATPC